MSASYFHNRFGQTNDPQKPQNITNDEQCNWINGIKEHIDMFIH